MDDFKDFLPQKSVPVLPIHMDITMVSNIFYPKTNPWLNILKLFVIMVSW